MEGILALADETLRSQFDERIFVDLDADLRYIRRLDRDVNERGRTVESVKEQYLATVRPMHEQFVEPSKKYASFVARVKEINSPAIEAIIGQIMARFLSVQLMALEEMGNTLLSESIERALQGIVEVAARELGADNVTLHQYEKLTRGEFLQPDQFSAKWPEDARLEMLRSDGLSAHVVRDGTIRVPDTDAPLWRDLALRRRTYKRQTLGLSWVSVWKLVHKLSAYCSSTIATPGNSVSTM